MIKCLVAEDFKDLREIYTNILDHEEDICVCGSAANSKELFALLEKETPDIVLLDIEMETPDAGINNCARITGMYPNIKVIMLTCHEEEEKIFASFRAGAVNYILKTSSYGEIIESIRLCHQDRGKINPYASEIIRKKLRNRGDEREALLGIMSIINTLTNREMEILSLLLNGLKQRQIAQKQSVELPTVKSHIMGIHRKFKKKNTVEILKIINRMNMDDFIHHQAQLMKS